MLADPLTPWPHTSGRLPGDARPSLDRPFAGISISVFSPMVLCLSRGDNATARPSMAARTVAAADGVRVQCQSPAVASLPSADADLWKEVRTCPGRVDGRS